MKWSLPLPSLTVIRSFHFGGAAIMFGLGAASAYIDGPGLMGMLDWLNAGLLLGLGIHVHRVERMNRIVDDIQARFEVVMAVNRDLVEGRFGIMLEGEPVTPPRLH